MNVYEIDAIVEGTISEIKSYGAFLSFEDGRSGLLHIKQISDSYISNINTYLKDGASIKVRIIEIDEKNGFLKLSLKTVPVHERTVFAKNKNISQINPAQVDFSTLKEKLPLWIDEALKEMEND